MKTKAMLGHKVRRLRRDNGLGQAQMATMLGISPSYLNLIEHNHRPVTVPLLLKLGQAFDLELQAFAEDDETRVAAGLREIFADPLFSENDLGGQDLRDLASGNPRLAQAVITLYQAFRDIRQDFQALAEKVADRDEHPLVTSARFPVEEVGDFFNSESNHFPELEDAAEELRAAIDLDRGLQAALVDFVRRETGIAVKTMPADVLGTALRRFDLHSRRILLSEMLPPSGRTFQLAVMVAQLRYREVIEGIIARAKFSNEQARLLVRIGLANYFAGATVMPYAPFLKAAEGVRYDLEILQRRFDVSAEQVCHRLTTLQRPGAKGVPFFLIRVDKAGNVSKRFSPGGLHFARFGGACPRWNVHDAFRTPGVIHTQLARMPDGSTWFSIARTVTKPGFGFRSPPQQFAIGLGCEAAHAGQLVYGDGLDLENAEVATPIGVNCRLCPRLDCSQRAFPPLNPRLVIDTNMRGLSTYTAVPAADA